MQPGTVVAGRYVIEAFAGVGGMSSVFQARDRDGRLVALKMLQLQATHLDARFVRETNLIYKLRHPAIVRYLDSGVTETGQRFLVLEWLEGVDLYNRIKKERLSLEETLLLIERIASALGFAHAHGVVHRDVKPNNIFLPGGSAAAAKLLDFGIARWITASDILTNTGARFGTPAYMSPEQVRGDRSLDARADVFSLGCVLFECLTGEPAFAAKDPMAVFGKILFADPPRAGHLDPDVPEPLDALLQRMLARDPAQRPTNGDEVAVEIRQLRAGLAHSDWQRQPRHKTSPDTLTDLELRLVSVVVAAVGASERDDASATRPPAAELGLQTENQTTNLDLPLAPSGPRDTQHETPATMAQTGGVTRPVVAPPLGLRLDDVRAQCDALGAQLVVLHDGSLVAVLENRGAALPRTAADLAMDAARCALALRQAFPRALVALATGKALVAQERFVGEVIDRAVQLLAARTIPPAAPDRAPARQNDTAPDPGADTGADTAVGAEQPGIRIDDITAGLVLPRFEVERDPDGQLWLRGERQDDITSPPPTPVALPFVGRNGELATLTAILDECIDEQVARAVLITASAGIGKSRLCDEFLQRVRERDIEIWIAQGDRMRAGSPLHLLSAAVRRAAGIVESEPLATRWRKLQSRVARCLPADQAGRVAMFLGEMLKMPWPHDDDVQLQAARMDPKLMGDQMRRACADLLDAETRAQPVLFVIEDLHWGDRATVEVLDLALRNLADRPFLILALGRPDTHDLFPQLWSTHNVTEIRLSRLPRRAAERLVEAAMGMTGHVEQLAAIVERGDGNPFYLQELARRVASGESTLPETVMAMVHARLGALEPQTRRALRAASIFGGVFWRGGVVALTGDEEGVDAWLEELQYLELIAPAPAARFPRETEYGFRHALIQEGAYGMLTDADRQLGHRLAGIWLDEVGEVDAQVLAEHFDRGGTPERALEYYRRAAEDALRRSDFDAAMAMAERGIACGAEGPALGALRRVQMEEKIWRGKTDEVARLGLEAMRLVHRASREWYDIAGEVGIAWGKLGEVDRVEGLAVELRASVRTTSDLAGRLIATAKLSHPLFVSGRNEQAEVLLAAVESEAHELDDEVPVLAANIHLGRAYRADTVLGDPAAVLDELEQCAACFEAIGDVRHACLHRSNVGYARLELGLYDQAEADLRSALDIAERVALDLAANAARQNLGLLLSQRGKLREAEALERQASQWFEARGDTRMAALSRLYLAMVLTRDGELDSAEYEARSILANLAESTPLRPLALALLARIHLLRGQPEPALAASSEAMRLLENQGAVESGEVQIRLVHAEALDASGNRAAARAAIARVRDWLLARAGKISRADWRRSFLENISEHVRALELAQKWSA